jgi:hypothetical protein
MDPLVPIAGLSVEQYAELSAEVAAARGDPLKVGEALGRAGLSAPLWEQAHAGWSARLADPALGAAIAGTFESKYHAALDRLLGAGPDVPPEDFVVMLGEALMWGLPTMAQRRGIDTLAWSRISYRSRVALSAEPAHLSACLALAGQIAERRLSGAVPATGSKEPSRAFEKDASVAAKAVGKAVVSGFDAFGSALDSVGKSLFGPGVGKPVVVQWSDGKQYPGTVAQVGKGQYLVTMGDGSQRWVPEAFVKPV